MNDLSEPNELNTETVEVTTEQMPLADRIAMAFEAVQDRLDYLEKGMTLHDENQRKFAQMLEALSENQQSLAKAISTVDAAVGGLVDMVRDHHRGLVRAGLIAPEMDAATKPPKERVLN